MLKVSETVMSGGVKETVFLVSKRVYLAVLVTVNDILIFAGKNIAGFLRQTTCLTSCEEEFTFQLPQFTTVCFTQQKIYIIVLYYNHTCRM